MHQGVEIDRIVPQGGKERVAFVGRRGRGFWRNEGAGRGQIGPFFEEVVDAFDELGPFADEAVAAAGERIVDRTRNGEDVAPELGGKARRDERAEAGAPRRPMCPATSPR